jgi:hypothetical protein
LAACVAVVGLTAASACRAEAPSPTQAPVPSSSSAPATDPLASWNEGASKTAILDFVARVTRDGGPDFVPVPERIATFDNGGTLWPEQPVYFQVAFALDRVRALAPEHPEWKQKQPFKAILEGNLKAALAGGERAILAMMAATHVGNTTDEFAKIVTEWVGSARHPKSQRLYTEMVYQPMLELLAFLRAKATDASTRRRPPRR